MLSRPAGPTRGHFVLLRFLVLFVAPARPATACVGPAPEPGTARPRSRLLRITRPGAGGPYLVPRAPPPEPRTTRRPLLSPCRAARPAPGLVILAETTPQTGPSRSRASRSRAGGSLPGPLLAPGLALRAAGLPQPASTIRRTLGRASGGRARPGAPPQVGITRRSRAGLLGVHRTGRLRLTALARGPHTALARRARTRGRLLLARRLRVLAAGYP